MRLFVAITPPENVVEDLDAFLDVRRDAGPQFRWTDPDQWHLTLAFCADFPERRLDELDERLARAAAKRRPVEARLVGGGAFPNVGRARVLWAGFEAGFGAGFETDPVEVERMATGARAAMAKAGGAVDGQRFRAHLTLARTSRPLEATRWVHLLDGYAGPGWTVDRIHLIGSHLGEGPRRRPRHETLGTFPLRPAGAIDRTADGDVPETGSP